MSVLINNPNSTCRCILGMTTAGFLAGGGLGAIGSAVGSIFGGIGQAQASKNYLKGVRETNATNLQIAQETNAQNYKVWQEEQQHNIDMYNMQKQNEWDMWNAENSYNSASAQRQRLEEAGYNPYLAIGGMSGNLASGMTNPAVNATHPPTMQGATMQAPGIEGYYNGLSAVGQSFEGISKAVETYKQIENLQKDIDTKDYDLKFKKSIEKSLKDTADAQAREADANARRANALADIEDLNYSERQILNKYVDANAQIDFVENLNNLWTQYQQYQLNEQELTLKTIETLNSVLEANTSAATQFTILGGLSATYSGLAELGDLVGLDVSGLNSFTQYLNSTLRALGRIPELIDGAVNASDGAIFNSDPANAPAVSGQPYTPENYSYPIISR